MKKYSFLLLLLLCSSVVLAEGETIKYGMCQNIRDDFYVNGGSYGQVMSKYNATHFEWVTVSAGQANDSWNQSYANTLYAPNSVVSDNISWSEEYANGFFYTVANGSLDNVSWNETRANTLYATTSSLLSLVNLTPTQLGITGNNNLTLVQLGIVNLTYAQLALSNGSGLSASQMSLNTLLNLSIAQLGVDGSTNLTPTQLGITGDNNLTIAQLGISGTNNLTLAQLGIVNSSSSAQYTMIQANITSTSATVLTNLTNLQVVLLKASNYTITCNIYYQSYITTAGIALAFSTNDTAGAKKAINVIIPTSATATFYGYTPIFNTALVGTAVPAANSTWFSRLQGEIETSPTTDLLVIPAFRTEVAGAANTVTVLSMSNCEARKV